MERSAEATAEARPSRRAPAFDRLCRALALLGGVILLAATAVTVVSVTGRYLFGRPIPGDIELLGLLMAVAVSLFLPYCQLRKGNVIVDVFTEKAPPAVRGALDALGSLALAAAAAVLAWRMALGGIELRAAGDESMVLRLPTWIAFVVIVPCFGLLAAASIVTIRRDLRDSLRPGDADAGW